MDAAVNKSLARWILLLLFLSVTAVVVPSLLLRGTSETSLAASTQLTGAVSQAIGIGSNGELSQYGKDFTLSDTQYFDSNEWAITTIDSLQDNNKAFAILHKESVGYKVVLGPGTAFDSGYTKAIPADLTNYLRNKGILYDSAD